MTVWCVISAEKVIGPYFFGETRSQPLTVNDDRYRDMIRDFVIPDLRENDMEDYWFQENDATYHTARKTMDLLKEFFGN